MDQVEDDCARAVELALAAEGRVVGARTRRDAKDASGLRVDFTYDDAVPPIALEITTVQDTRFLGTHAAARKLQDRLERLRVDEGLEPYEIAIHEHADIKTAEPLLREAMRMGIDDLDYTSDDLETWTKQGTVEAQRAIRGRLAAARVEQVRRDPDRWGTTVTTSGESHWGPLTDLENECAANVAKLLEAGTLYEGHLAVGIGRYGITNDPTITPIPELPDGVSRLWVMHLWAPPGADLTVWSITARAAGWSVEPSLPRSAH